MRVTTAGYAAVVSALASVARKSGALALVTEGGYDLAALEGCLDASLASLRSSTGPPSPPEPSAPAPRGERALRAVRQAHAGIWRF